MQSGRQFPQSFSRLLESSAETQNNEHTFTQMLPSLLRAAKSNKLHFEKDSRRSLNIRSSSLSFVSTHALMEVGNPT